MAIGDGMLAQVLLDYFQQHAEEFEQFVLERAGISEGYVRWRGEEPQKRLVLKRIFPAHFGERRTISESYWNSCSAL
jgi:hypothetical protein